MPSEKIGNVDNGEIPCQAWTTRMPKYAQADLNYTAPEIQHKSVCSLASDMFSFGLLMVSVFNGGQSLIQANYSTNLYFKQAGVVRRYSYDTFYLLYLLCTHLKTTEFGHESNEHRQSLFTLYKTSL